MPFTPPAGYPYSDDSSPGANDGDVVYAEHVNSIMEYLDDTLPGEIAAAGGVVASDAAPEDLGTPDPGVSTDLSRADHVHDMPSAADVGAATAADIAAAIDAHEIDTDPHGDRAYTDAAIAALTPTNIYQGIIDCSSNPDYPAADADHTYRVSVAGKIGGASGVTVEVGDLAVCLDDGTASGDQATVGANWTIVQGNLNGVVIGPTVSTNDRIALFNGTSGDVIKQASVTISDLDAYTVAETADWPGSDPTTQTAGLNVLAERVTDAEANITTLQSTVSGLSSARVIQVAVSDPNGAVLKTGDGKAYAMVPAAMNGLVLTAVQAGVTTVSSSGAVTVQVARVRSGTPADMLSTAITIDASEVSSTTAATPAVINTSNDDIATDDFLRIDIDGAGTGTKGLIVTLTYTAP